MKEVIINFEMGLLSLPCADMQNSPAAVCLQPLRCTGGRVAAVTLENVRKVYPGGHVAAVSFHAAAAEPLVLVGPSGCGKSILLWMIAGLEPIDAGSLRIGAWAQP